MFPSLCFCLQHTIVADVLAARAAIKSEAERKGGRGADICSTHVCAFKRGTQTHNYKTTHFLSFSYPAFTVLPSASSNSHTHILTYNADFSFLTYNSNSTWLSSATTKLCSLLFSAPLLLFLPNNSSSAHIHAHASITTTTRLFPPNPCLFFC